MNDNESKSEASVFFVDFPTESRGPYDRESLGDFELAYAITIHKAQGSEWDGVVLALGERPLDRAMLYTAATRAKTTLVIVGPLDLVEKSAARHRERQTLLRPLLADRSPPPG